MAHDIKKMEANVEEDLIHHDEDVIDRKRTDEKEHEAQLKREHNGLLRDLREEEIKHDEKEIARKEKDAARHEAHAKADEQVITGKK